MFKSDLLCRRRSVRFRLVSSRTYDRTHDSQKALITTKWCFLGLKDKLAQNWELPFAVSAAARLSGTFVMLVISSPSLSCCCWCRQQCFLHFNCRKEGRGKSRTARTSKILHEVAMSWSLVFFISSSLLCHNLRPAAGGRSWGKSSESLVWTWLICFCWSCAVNPAVRLVAWLLGAVWVVHV